MGKLIVVKRIDNHVIYLDQKNKFTNNVAHKDTKYLVKFRGKFMTRNDQTQIVKLYFQQKKLRQALTKEEKRERRNQRHRIARRVGRKVSRIVQHEPFKTEDYAEARKVKAFMDTAKFPKMIHGITAFFVCDTSAYSFDIAEHYVRITYVGGKKFKTRADVVRAIKNKHTSAYPNHALIKMILVEVRTEPYKSHGRKLRKRRIRARAKTYKIGG